MGMPFSLSDCWPFPGSSYASQALSLEGGTSNLERRRTIMAKDAEGMRGYRSRNQDGELRDKRDDTHVGISPVTSKCTTLGRIKMYHPGTLVF